MRRIQFSRSMLLPILALLLLFLAMPMEFIGGWGADHRLLVAVGLLAIGSIQPVPEARRSSMSVTGWTLAVLVILSLLIVRIAAVTIEWRRANVQYAEFQRAFEKLSDGSRVYFAFGHEAGQQIWPAPFYHLPHLALATKDVYVPYLSVGSAVTLQYRPEVEPLQRLSKGAVLKYGQSPDWAAIVDHFDYFLVVDEKYFHDAPPTSLKSVMRGNRVTLYKRSSAK